MTRVNLFPLLGVADCGCVSGCACAFFPHYLLPRLIGTSHISSSTCVYSSFILPITSFLIHSSSVSIRSSVPWLLPVVVRLLTVCLFTLFVTWFASSPSSRLHSSRRRPPCVVRLVGMLLISFPSSPFPSLFLLVMFIFLNVHRVVVLHPHRPPPLQGRLCPSLFTVPRPTHHSLCLYILLDVHRVYPSYSSFSSFTVSLFPPHGSPLVISLLITFVVAMLFTLLLAYVCIPFSPSQLS